MTKPVFVLNGVYEVNADKWDDDYILKCVGIHYAGEYIRQYRFRFKKVGSSVDIDQTKSTVGYEPETVLTWNVKTLSEPTMLDEGLFEI